jgi:Protein of unknown function (DUF4038)
MRQDGHFNGTPTWARIASDYELIPAKPVIDGEPIYEDHPIGFDSPKNGYSTATDCRRFIYWIYSAERLAIHMGIILCGSSIRPKEVRGSTDRLTIGLKQSIARVRGRSGMLALF